MKINKLYNMKTIKRPYTPVCDLELVPVECISNFAVILPRAFIAVRDGSYRIPVIPGSFTPGVESEQADSGTIYYNVGHTFEVALTGPDSQELLSALSLQDLVAIYTNEAGERIVSGSPQTPLKLTFSIVSGKYQCKLSGKQVYIEAYHSPF